MEIKLAHVIIAIMKSMISYFLVGVFMAAILSINALGLEVKLVDILEFKKSEAPIKPWSMSLSGDGIFIITDRGDQSIRLYSREKETSFLKLNGKITGVLPGTSGYQISQPSLCSYNRDTSQLVVMDDSRNTILFYVRKEGTRFEFCGEYFCPRNGYDMKFWKNFLVISGHETTSTNRQEIFELYAVDMAQIGKKGADPIYLKKYNTPVIYLLPSQLKYGLGSVEINSSLFSDQRKLGRKGWLDIQGDTCYYVWEGDLKIFKIDLKSGTIIGSFHPGKENVPGYKKPTMTDTLREALRINSAQNNNMSTILAERARMSFVKKLFVGKKFIFLVVEGPGIKGEKQVIRLLWFSVDGTYMGESLLEGKPGWRFYYDREKSRLYSISERALSQKENQRYSLLGYKIDE